MQRNGSEAWKYSSNASVWENVRVASTAVIHIMIHEREYCRVLH